MNWRRVHQPEMQQQPHSSSRQTKQHHRPRELPLYCERIILRVFWFSLWLALVVRLLLLFSMETNRLDGRGKPPPLAFSVIMGRFRERSGCWMIVMVALEYVITTRWWWLASNTYRWRGHNNIMVLYWMDGGMNWIATTCKWMDWIGMRWDGLQ